MRCIPAGTYTQGCLNGRDDIPGDFDLSIYAVAGDPGDPGVRDVTITRPFWIYSLHDKTGHASLYLYDRAVPVVFFGAGVKKGRGGTTELINLAPTLSRLLTIPNPAAAQGRSIDEVFR
jgi:hypothetical protein